MFLGGHHLYSVIAMHYLYRFVWFGQSFIWIKYTQNIDLVRP